MTLLKRRSARAVPPAAAKDVLLLRLGARTRTGDASVDSGPSLRLLGARECNARGTPLTYAPHSHRCHAEHVPRWVQHCRSVIHERKGRSIMEEREKLFIAMGFFTLTIIRRWRKWANRQAGLRRLLAKLSVGVAFHRWKRASRVAAFQEILERLAIRGAVHRWRRELERRAAFEAAVEHCSRSLMTQVLNAWVIHRSNTDLNRDRLRESMERWRSWQQRWKTRVKAFHRFIARRELASAVDRWRRETSASRCRRRRGVLDRLLGSLLLRKCFVALTKEALYAATLRRLLERYRKFRLLEGLEVWRRWFLRLREAKNTPKADVIDSAPESEVCFTTIRQPAQPRKGHCRCVYAISRRERCTCAPRTHLLRRVEELHRLVAKGLEKRGGCHRLLSHVVQRAPTPSDVGDTFRSTGKNRSPQTFSADPPVVVTSSTSTVGGGTAHATDFRRRAGRADPDGSRQPRAYKRGGMPTATAVKDDEDVGTGIHAPPAVADRSRCQERDVQRSSPCRGDFAPSRPDSMTHW